MTNKGTGSDRLFYYPIGPFHGDPARLADCLAAVGVQVKFTDEYRPCIEDRDADGHPVREIGKVFVYDDGRVVVRPYSDVTDDNLVVLLRTGERVVTQGLDGPDEPGWDRCTTDAGEVYRVCVVVVFLDEDGAAAAEDRVAAREWVDEEFRALLAAGGLS